MGPTSPSEGVLLETVERPDTEDSNREPDTSQVRDAPEVRSDNPTVHVRGRRIEENVSMVEGVAEIIDTSGRIVGTTTYRRWEEKVGQPDELGSEQTNTK